MAMASDVSSGEEREEEEPVPSGESMRGPVVMERGKRGGSCEAVKEMDGSASDDGSGDEISEEVWEEKLLKSRLKLEEFKKKKGGGRGAVSGGAMEGSVAESGDVERKGHVRKQKLAIQRKEKMESWEEALKGDLVKKGPTLEKKRIEFEKQQEGAKLKKKKGAELEKQEKAKFKFKNKEERTKTLSNKAKRRSGGEGEGTSLEENENAEVKKGRRSGEEQSCGGEKMKVDLRKLEQIATLKEMLLSKGISKVAVSGLSKEEKKKCPLPSSLVAEVRSAGLLFVKCSENGVAVTTTNFYLGRAYGLPVVNASFLLDWEEQQKLPILDNYVVVGSYLKGGKVVALKPLKEPLMVGEVFRLGSGSFKGNDYPVDLIKELIIRMGGSVVDEDSTDVKAHNIGSEFIQGKELFRPDWVLDMVEQGRVLAKKRFLVELEEDDDEGIFSQVRRIKLYSKF